MGLKILLAIGLAIGLGFSIYVVRLNASKVVSLRHYRAVISSTVKTGESISEVTTKLNKLRINHWHDQYDVSLSEIGAVIPKAAAGDDIVITFRFDKKNKLVSYEVWCDDNQL